MKQTQIKKITAHEVLDSRGNPTVRAVMTLSDGTMAEATVPSGASTGDHEAHELRDGGDRYGGKGVLKAVKHVQEEIAPALMGKDASKQQEIDQIMIDLDGTENKRRLGANAILAVSLVAARASAKSLNTPLYQYIRTAFDLQLETYTFPTPGVNIINGGQHADNNVSCQEFMVLPKHTLFSERVRMAAQVFHTLKGILKEKGYSTGVGDEGGFAPNLSSNEEAVELIIEAIEKAGWKPGTDIAIGLDVAASEFYRDGQYYFTDENKPGTAKELIAILAEWVEKYPIISIEDPLDQDDWDNWTNFTKELGNKITIVGDDIFVTNKKRVQKGIDTAAANSVLIKVNQIGTLSETIATINLARENNMSIFISHRSGETVDTFIADLAIAVNAEFIKAGSMSRAERVEKYNRLMEIEDELKS